MPSRSDAIDAALEFFDDGRFAERLGRLVAIPSTSQDPGHEADLHTYLHQGISPWLEAMGFTVAIHANPNQAGGPILTAERIEDASRPTILTYGHGDTVRGLEDQWSDGLRPWELTDRGDRWYGRGSADNKGQHVLNLTALEQVLAARGGRLGANVRLLLETSEERGSLGLREFVSGHRDLLAADALIASDGPRVSPETPTLSCGTRGSFNFDLKIALRPGGVHSGNWGGLIADPAIILAHAIASIVDRHGRILVRDWVPASGIPNSVRAALAGCELRSEGETATIDPGWGEPGLSPAERVFGWTSFIVLAMLAGRPENPVNAVSPWARATCQLRYTVDVDPETFMPALRRHLDAAGFPEVTIDAAGSRMAASRTDPSGPWVRWASGSMEQSLGRKVQVIPNAGGGLPGDVFVDALGVPLIWVPHSYNGCKQHGPDEHFLKAPAREGMAAFAGIWWDLGDWVSPRSA
jgi:acetylornithine deacetylase/succinyl-diaminopimelate desuccinylase-like protein